MSLKDTYDQLKTAVIGTRTVDIDTKLDSAVKDIVSFKSQSGRNGFIELVKNLISKGGQFDLSSGGLFQQLPTPAVLGQGSRLLRYKSYEAIVSNINYAHRALDVLVDNILSPDDITKTALEIKPKTFLEDQAQTSSDSENVKEIVEKVKLEQKLDLIVKNTLQMGDFFSEIANAKTALTSKSAFLAEDLKMGSEGTFLFESFVHFQNNDLKDTLTVDIIRESDTGEKVNEQFKIIMDYSSLDDIVSNAKSMTKLTGDTTEEKKDKKPEDIYLLFYDPKRVVKLQSDMYPLCFGYLIFPSAVLTPHLMLQNQAVNQICNSVLRSLEKKIPQIKDSSVNEKEIKEVIALMLKESDPSKSMSIRYVPPDKMVHFHKPGTKYYPYGDSIFDPVQFTAKILIALETALTIFRLNRSTEKRKVLVEIGLPRDARKAIEKLKEEFKKRKISIDSFGSVDTIPSIINTFEDVYIPQKDGKSFVDIQSFNEGGIDTRGKVDEIKMIRDQFVAALQVPASYIGLEENTSNRNTLSEESVLFARAIVNHQKYLSHQINELIEKIYKIIDPEKALTVLDNVTIGFPAPKSLQFERQSKYLSDLANLVQTLEGIGIPREWSKKKYLTDIDWKDVEDFITNHKIEKSLKTGEHPEEDQGGMGALGGMGGGGMMPPMGGGGMM